MKKFISLGTLFGKKIQIEECDKRTMEAVNDFIVGKTFQFFGGKEVIQDNAEVKKMIKKILKL